MLQVRQDDLSGAESQQLLALHVAAMHATSPPGCTFALDLSGLQAPEVTVWSVREGDAVLGIGALKELGDGTAEIKSMRTHPDHLRRGVGALLLDHIVAAGKTEGLDPPEPGNGNRPGIRTSAGALPQARLREWGGVLRLPAERFQSVSPPVAVRGRGRSRLDSLRGFFADGSE